MNEKRSILDAIKGMFVGLVHPEEYIENGKKSSWGAALLLAIIFSLLTPLLTFVLPINKVVGNGRLTREIEREIPDFSLSEDGFYCEGRHVWTDHYSVYVEIDTDNTYVNDDVLEDLLQSTDYQSVMIIYSKEGLLYSDGRTQTIAWSDLFNDLNNQGVIDKGDVLQFLDSSLKPVLRAIYFFLVVFTFIGFLLCGLLWALIGLIAASSNNTKISFGELVKASIYIRIIWSTVRKLINAYVFSGTSMLMWVVGFVIILVYMFLAINKYAKKQPAPIYGGGAQAIPNTNMYYGGQSMGNMTGQYQPMGMNMNPNTYQNNQNMYQNNPNTYQNNPNMYQNPNTYQNNPNADWQNSNSSSYQGNDDNFYTDEQNNDQL